MGVKKVRQGVREIEQLGKEKGIKYQRLGPKVIISLVSQPIHECLLLGICGVKVLLTQNRDDSIGRKGLWPLLHICSQGFSHLVPEIPLSNRAAGSLLPAALVNREKLYCPNSLFKHRKSLSG